LVSHARRQFEPPPQIDGGHDLPRRLINPSITRRLRHVRHLLEAQNLLHAENIYAENRSATKNVESCPLFWPLRT